MNFLGDCNQCQNLQTLINKMGHLNYLSENAQEAIEELIKQADEHIQERHIATVGKREFKEELERLKLEYENYR